MDGQGGARVKPEVMEEPASKRPRTADEQNLLESMQAEIKALKDQLATTGGGGAGAGSAKVKKEVELPPATFDLGGMRKLQVRTFKSHLLIDIREYYKSKEPGAEEKPGKKGIALNQEQWDSLRAQVEAIDLAVRQRMPASTETE